MGYKEEIFRRLELSNFRSVNEISAWLAGPKRSRSSYTNIASQYAKALAIAEDIKTASTLKDINVLSRRAQSSPIADGILLEEANDKIKILEGEANELANIIKTTSRFSELQNATEQLRELAPQKLGGIKSGQIRFRGSKKEAKIVSRTFSRFQEQIESGELG